jgi:3-oxoacyl-[acyl-carrier-protein] synthase-3
MKIVGVGSAIPERFTTSPELESQLGLKAGWIARRTGIDRRPTAAPEEATSDLAIQSGERALKSSGIDKRDVGLLLLATSTPDHLLPPTAPLVANKLGLNSGAIDMAGACSGFLYALILGSHWADASGKSAIIVGANILTRRVNPKDPATVALFSDGAGAVVIAPSNPTSLLGSYLGSDGSSYGSIGIRAGGTREPITAENLKEGANLMTMRRGASLFKHAVHGMADAGKEALKQAQLTATDIDWWIPHQANARIIQDVGELLTIPPERTINVVSQYGNSSAATIPIAMAGAKSRFKAGDRILLTAAGAGLVTAAAVVRW